MKKNITINLFGQLYNIDEDAYELLRGYEENLRAYFMRREGGEEVADDIEHRIAELLAQLKADGTEAVSINHIRDIINRIGNPEQMAEGEDSASASASSGTTPPPPPFGGNASRNERPRKKLFRDPDDKMLGGVLSGLCRYFGFSDPLLWRITFVLLCLFTVSSLALVYLVLWVLIPKARTPEDRLLMRGEAVTAASLGEEMVRAGRTATNYARKHTGGMRGCLGGLLKAIIALVIGFCIFLLFILLLAAFCSIAALIVIAFFPAQDVVVNGIRHPELTSVLQANAALRWWTLGVLISALTVFLLPLVALVRSVFGKGKLSRTWRVVLAVSWFVALFASILCGTAVAKHGSDTIDKLEKKYEERYRKDYTRDGIFLNADSWDYLKQSGWNIGTLKNADEEIVHHCQDPRVEDGSSWLHHLSIERDDDDLPLSFDLYRTLQVEPGTYRIEALVYTDGGGASLYASLDSTRLAALPLHTSSKIPTAQEKAELERMLGYKIEVAAENLDDDDYEQASTGWDYGWRPISLTLHVSRAGTLRYGFSNLEPSADNTASLSLFRTCCVSAKRIDATPQSKTDSI